MTAPSERCARCGHRAYDLATVWVGGHVFGNDDRCIGEPNLKCKCPAFVPPPADKEVKP